jgi:hypothetical protein
MVKQIMAVIMIAAMMMPMTEFSERPEEEER